jgi:hypothetical protein
MKNTIKLLLATASVALFTACGGGGGGGTPAVVASTSTFPLFTIHVNSLQAASNTFTLSGNTTGNIPITGSGTATRGGLSAGTFEGASHQQRTVVVTGTLSGNGRTVPLNSSGIDWYDSNYIPKGATGGEDYVVVTGTPVIPATVRVNDTGTVYTANRWSNSSKTVLRGTDVVSWVIEADTATTALLSLISTEKNTSNVTTSISTQLIRIRPDGTFTRIKETILDLTDNTTMTLTYN